MLNIIAIAGRLTRDPELRYTQSQTPVASFTLATERDFKSDGGEKQTDFIDCVAWRQTAEFIGKYFTKGSMAIVSGRLQLRAWTDKDGNKRRTAEVVAEHVYFAGEKKPGSGAQRPYGDNYAPPTYTEPDAGDVGGAFAQLSDDDGELPF